MSTYYVGTVMLLAAVYNTDSSYQYGIQQCCYIWVGPVRGTFHSDE